MKKTAIATALLVIGIGTYVFLSGTGRGESAPQSAGAPPVIEVGVQTIEPENADLSMELPGRTSAYKVAEIRPQVSGIIVERFFEEGSDIKEGQQLYQIDPAPYQAAYDSAQADLLKAEANIKTTKAKQARYAELVKVGGVSKQEYDDTNAALAQSEADVAIAKASVATAKINLDYTKVFSPISGRIGRSSITQGALVTANQTVALATVQQLDPIFVDIIQPSKALLQIKKDFSSGKIKSAGNDQREIQLKLEDDSDYPHTGILQFSEVRVDESTGAVTLRAVFKNPDGLLLPGMFVRAQLPEGIQEQAVLVPQRSVTRDTQGNAIAFIADEKNTVQQRVLTIERSMNDGRLLVRDGLHIGDRIIVQGLQNVRPGVQVKPVPIDNSVSETQK